MLFLVNIVPALIGTDCGRSAPVVGVYRQPRLAEGVLPTGNYYCTRIATHTMIIHYRYPVAHAYIFAETAA